MICPRRSSPRAKRPCRTEERQSAEKAFDGFVKTYAAKYPKAVQCLEKDRDRLLTFYDFPAQHWPTSARRIPASPSSPRFGTERIVRQGYVTRDTMLTMIYKLGLAAEKGWRRIRGFDYLAKVITGVKFKDGIEITPQGEESKVAA
jgi:putative transposase